MVGLDWLTAGIPQIFELANNPLPEDDPMEREEDLMVIKQGMFEVDRDFDLGIPHGMLSASTLGRSSAIALLSHTCVLPGADRACLINLRQAGLRKTEQACGLDDKMEAEDVGDADGEAGWGKRFMEGGDVQEPWQRQMAGKSNGALDSLLR